MIAPHVALALVRLCFDAAAITAYGVSGFIACVAPKRLGQAITASSNFLTVAASSLAVFSTLAWLPIEAAVIGESWQSALDRSTLSVLLCDTAMGKAWLVRLALSLLLAAALLWRSTPIARLALSGLLLASLALTGHANMDEGTRGVLHILNDAAHLLAGGAWLGSLLALPGCLARLRDPAFCTEAKTALRRFSSAGHLAVALAIATGIVNTVLVLGRWPTDFTSTYQMLLVAKMALVAGMTGLALVNRYIFVPHMVAEPDRAIIQIRHGTYAELALGAGVLALVAFFGILDPT
ncbi:copper homeostasis membrane protein CopD [Bradyrhizobium erythrophlei]|uniref:Putative copper resistance protein D n=1 Tax=Bradyrhizobium erythrophlei TaxID=1437360 RepID=A0A1M5HYI2_9BRAD|nr:copper homeostasis membrane protein CopD [Bradyrhizobium erythrophlei]SHG21076.1 putative copper resistance protein D [Bradyrhizobium erythrophlei]